MKKFNLARIDGHVLTTRDKRRIAFYLLPPARWSFRPNSECEAMLTDGAQRYAQLIGRALHLRVTTKPYPVDRWARTLDFNSPDALDRNVPGGWGDFLEAEQRHVLGLTLADRQAFIGVELNSRASRLAGLTGRAQSAADIADVDRIIAGPGLDGSPATAGELEWLLHRSVSLGMPAPATMAPPREVWETEDVAEVTDSAVWTAQPYARTVQVSADISGVTYTRHVVVLTVGRMGDLTIPGSMDPWMQMTDRLPFPVEWSATVKVQPNEVVVRNVQDAMNRIRAQVEHFTGDHGIDPPQALERQRARALDVEDEITSNASGLETRTEGWYRLAVSGESEEQALERAAAVVELYAPAITLIRAADQYRMAREFIPGEPLANDSYKRRLPVLTLASAVPAATALVGDREGIHIGYTCGSSMRAVMWEPWRKIEVREGSGLVAIAGSLGSGKSSIIGLIAYKNVRRGIPFVVLDPSGRLTALCDLPELAPYSRAVDLMRAAPGTLNPYRVVAQPRKSTYTDPAEFEREQALAGAERQALCSDVLTMLLPAQITAMPQTPIALGKAVRKVGGSNARSPNDVLKALRDAKLQGSYAEHAANIAGILEDIATMPQAQLFFPTASSQATHGYDEDEDLLTVLSLQGLVMPSETSNRADWSTAERLSVPLLHLAAWLTTRSIYNRSPHQRKAVALDETHVLSSVPSGRALISRISRDSRKWNLLALMASQNVSDITAAGIDNFIGATFVGRTEGADAQKDALAALRIPTGVGYEKVLGSLSAQSRRAETRSGIREWLFSDGSDGLEKIRIDVSGTPSLAKALDTTSDPSQAPRRLHEVAEVA